MIPRSDITEDSFNHEMCAVALNVPWSLVRALDWRSNCVGECEEWWLVGRWL